MRSITRGSHEPHQLILSILASGRYGCWEDLGKDPQGVEWRRTLRRALAREFGADESDDATGICAYCERQCKASKETQGRNGPHKHRHPAAETVDHFRPKGLPAFHHQWLLWSNLMYVCHRCNQLKAARWPSQTCIKSLFPDSTSYVGYVTPNSNTGNGHYMPAERFFNFDFVTGEIKVATHLDCAMRKIAEITIRDFGLNASSYFDIVQNNTFDKIEDKIAELRAKYLLNIINKAINDGRRSLEEYKISNREFSSVIICFDTALNDVSSVLREVQTLYECSSNMPPYITNVHIKNFNTLNNHIIDHGVDKVVRILRDNKTKNNVRFVGSAVNIARIFDRI